jgi:hypothetical protein
MPRAEKRPWIEDSIRDIFDKQTRRKPLAFAADALSYGD